MVSEVFSKCGMRCDLCLLYRPNVEQNDRRSEICGIYSKIWPGFRPDPKQVICDGCANMRENITLFSSDCAVRQCVLEKGYVHCGYCEHYPCDIFPAEPTEEALKQKIDVEKQWTWEEEKLMEAYCCKKYMDEFRKNQK